MAVNSLLDPGEDIREVYPELTDLETIESMTYELGEVTAHNHLRIRGAGTNTMDRARRACLVLPQPADARGEGAPPKAFDPAAHKMTPCGTFPDEGFPFVA